MRCQFIPSYILDRLVEALTKDLRHLARIVLKE